MTIDNDKKIQGEIAAIREILLAVVLALEINRTLNDPEISELVNISRVREGDNVTGMFLEQFLKDLEWMKKALSIATETFRQSNNPN